MADFIAYYRVSTDRQGSSGLGLDAQRQAVAGFVGCAVGGHRSRVSVSGHLRPNREGGCPSRS